MLRNHFRNFVSAALLIVFGACLGVPAGAAGAATTGAVTPGPAPAQVLKVRILPQGPNYALPPTTAGCGGAISLTGGASRVPITVSVLKDAFRSAQESVNVCIDGKGPFPFEIDTGAGISVVSTSLALQLGLPDIGPSNQAGGLGCTLTAQPVLVSSWSLAGVNLAPQIIISAKLPDLGTAGNPVGLLGSDVLLRFGAVRIDFAKQSMTLAGPEGASPTGGAAVHGMTGPPPARAVTLGQRGITVPATVVLAPGAAKMYVKVRFKSGPRWTFAVDTGSSATIVSSSVAKMEHLASTNLLDPSTTVCSTTNVPVVQSGSWSLQGVPLHHPQLIDSLPFEASATGGANGTLGSDQLVRFAWVIFDYSGGRLILG
jgi:hypothetical protein